MTMVPEDGVALDWRSVPCRLWTGCIKTGVRNGETGYGQRMVGGRREYVHRLAWSEMHGPIPEGMCVLHHCDNPPCHEPIHLFLGTHADNARDRAMKGRGARGERCWNARLTQADVDEIRRLCNGRLMTQTAIAEIYGVDQPYISNIFRRKAWVP